MPRVERCRFAGVVGVNGVSGREKSGPQPVASAADWVFESSIRAESSATLDWGGKFAAEAEASRLPCFAWRSKNMVPAAAPPMGPTTASNGKTTRDCSRLERRTDRMHVFKVDISDKRHSPIVVSHRASNTGRERGCAQFSIQTK